MARVSADAVPRPWDRARTIVRLSPFGRRLAIVALAALAWRLAYVQLELPYNVLTDEAWYIGQAHSLFGVHPWTSIFDPAVASAQHGPLTSILVAPFAWLFPHALAGLRNVMAVLGTCTVVMMGLTGKKLGGSGSASRRQSSRRPFPTSGSATGSWCPSRSPHSWWWSRCGSPFTHSTE